MLCAATSAPSDGVVPVLQREELVLVQHVGRARDVAGDEDVVGDHAVDVEGAAAGVAADAPQAGRQPGALQPLDVADRAERGHHHVGLERGAVGERGAAHVSVRVALRATSPTTPVAQVHAVLALHLRGDPRRSPRRARRPAAPRPRSATVTARPSSRQTEATSEPMNPAPTTSTRPGPAASACRSRAASSRVRSVNTPSSAASAGLNQGRARTPVAISSRSYADLARRRPGAPAWSARSSPVAATPSRQSASTRPQARQLVWSAGTHPCSTCLDSGGRSYGSCGSSPMMVRRPA